MKLSVSLAVVNSYKRLSYQPWHAIAELIDNSTESFYNHESELRAAAQPGHPPLSVRIDYSNSGDSLSVKDNAYGMARDDIEDALVVGKRPGKTFGRSRYGLGMKTAAFWLGDIWTIRTTRLGVDKEYTVTIRANEVVAHDGQVEITERKADKNSHFTAISVTELNRKFHTRTLSTIIKYLRSMYRVDLRSGVLELWWNSQQLKWEDLDDRLDRNKEGQPYRQDIDFRVKSGRKMKRVHGWAGLLARGSRQDAGFSILHANRVIRGWPDSWRPQTLFGQLQGSNDLVNQRLTGELFLDDFEVSHTKDDIVWLANEEEQVLDGLRDQCEWLRKGARDLRRPNRDQRGPTDAHTSAAVSALERELASPEMLDALSVPDPVSHKLVKSVFDTVRTTVIDKSTAKVQLKVGSLSVRCYIEDELASSAPYVTLDTIRGDEVVIIVNSSHPHWVELGDNVGVLNYLRHCVYDGIAEWQARQKVAQIDPDTIKLFKDKLLRIPLEIESHQSVDEAKA